MPQFTVTTFSIHVRNLLSMSGRFIAVLPVSILRFDPGLHSLKELRIDPKAIDPDDPEMLADLVMAAANEALRSAQAKVEAKMKSMLPSDLGGLLPGL